MKHSFKILIAILFGGFLITGCNNKETDKDLKTESIKTFDINVVKKIIQDNNDAFMKAHITRDTATLNNMYVKGAKVFPPNSEVVADMATIKAMNLEWVNYDIKEAREVSTALYGNNDYVIDEGTYYMSFGADSIIDEGKYLNIWKQEDGKWKMFRNMWNSSLPLTDSE